MKTKTISTFKKCVYCDGAGWIEMDNNGPIVQCPLCKGVGRVEVEVKP